VCLKCFDKICKRVTRLLSHVEQELPTLPEHLCTPPNLVVFELLELWFSVQCFVDYYVFLLPLYCLSVFDLQLLIPAFLMIAFFLAFSLSLVYCNIAYSPFGIQFNDETCSETFD
jgi:hypothetical protein